jgi:DNA-binding response OmpR family regulator
MDKILVVDDEPDIINLVSKILEKAGYWVSSAPTGDQALDLIKTEVPDLVLLDLVMPGRSGLEVCQILKSQPKTKNIPVIMFTALGRDVDKKLSSSAGADAYFTKPFKRAALLAELEGWLKDAQSSKFSRQLGLDHRKLRGKKILFEFDPQTDYEKSISDFAVESGFHEETTIVVTQNGSPVRRVFEKNRNVVLMDLDPRIKFSAILRDHPDGPLNTVFDSITGLALGEKFGDEPDRTIFRFAQNSLQILAQPRTTALFLLNPSAHTSREVASLRGIFCNQIAYSQEGLTVVKLEP